MARTHKTVQIKTKMAEQEHAAEEARRAGLARLRAARTRSERSQAREMMQKDQAGETSATDEAVEEEADGEIAQEDASASDGDEADDEEEKAADEEEEDEDAEHKQGAERTERRRQGEKRRVSDMEEEELTQVPVFKTQHDSWASLELCLKEYMEATRQKIVVKEVVNVGRRNAHLRAQVRYQGLPDSEIPLVPAEMEPYQRKYICTHGWSERDRSTGKSHKFNTTDCPFQMLAQVTKRRDGSWGIVMKREVYCHFTMRASL
ncbi:hypothetical protein PI124_g7243 [Phytophthora idaei]|nr:hypothetical protein PI125_g21898 [Phytophthora idaei]KAG3248068.1 hypothetical protein PI124_g7243 [Phytophthora idaei]